MTIDIKETEHGVTAVLTGRLDTAASSEVAGDFDKLQEFAGKEIILDCSALDYISSSGLRLFISLRKASVAKGGSVIIQHMNDSIRNVFTMTGFFRLFTIQD